MKKIMFGGSTGGGHIPFWQPWGALGCFGRLLLFLLLLFLFLLLMSLFHRCDNRPDMPEEFQRPGDTYVRPDSLAEDSTVADNNWNQPIPGGEDDGLPSPDDNQLPPFEDTEPVPNPDNDGTEIYPNMLYVIFDSDAGDETFKTFAKKFTSLYPQPKSKISYYNTSSKTAVLTVPEEQRSDICNKLNQQIPEVKFLVVPVEVMTGGEAQSAPRVVPNDPVFQYPKIAWYFQPIQAFEAWAITQGSPDVTVAIVDTYMDVTHDDLRSDRIVDPFSVEKGTSDVLPENGMKMDYAGHGTLVSAVAAGNANNAAGSSGIAPKCKLMPVSVGKNLNTVTMVEGILYAIYHGADVVNISAGAVFTDEAHRLSLDEQIEVSQQCDVPQAKMWDYVFNIAEERNTTIVWAAGNDNLYGAMDPSKRNRNTIRVSAVDRNLHKANFSNYGNFTSRRLYESTISAPGVDIFGALPGNTYDMWPGTSFSAPIIAGVVALMKSLNNNLTTQEIIKILQETGKDVEGAPEIGRLVQIRDALLKVKSQFANFTNDPNKLLGTWETTKAINFYRNYTNIFTGRGKIRLTISSPTMGTVTFFKNGRKYTAPMNVSISQQSVNLRQAVFATAQGSQDQFSIHSFVFHPDAQRKMACKIHSEVGNSDQDCYVRKIQ